MQENERYTEVCKPAFERLEDNTDEILRILKGSNGNPGLVDEVRENKRFRRAIAGAFVFIFSTLLVQLFCWIRTKL